MCCINRSDIKNISILILCIHNIRSYIHVGAYIPIYVLCSHIPTYTYVYVDNLGELWKY